MFVARYPSGEYAKGRHRTLHPESTSDLEKARIFGRLTDVKNSDAVRVHGAEPVPVTITLKEENPHV